MTSLSAGRHQMASPFKSSGIANVRRAPSFGGDVVLVLFWASLIPGLMWMGSLLGY